MNDWQDYNLARGGDRAAWKKVIGNHADSLTRLAAMLTGSPDLAQDVVQEVMLELFRRPPKHQAGTLRGWLTTVTYHAALKEKKRNAGWTGLEKSDLPDQAPLPLAQLIKDDGERRLFNVIQALETAQREVIVLRFYGERSLQDISEILEIPLGTVKSRLFYGVKHVRHHMKNKGLI